MTVFQHTASSVSQQRYDLFHRNTPSVDLKQTKCLGCVLTSCLPIDIFLVPLKAVAHADCNEPPGRVKPKNRTEASE